MDVNDELQAPSGFALRKESYVPIEYDVELASKPVSGAVVK
jgi:hypothetical protein